MFSHISSSVWRTLSHVCTLYSGWLLLCRTIQSTVEQYLYFKSRVPGSKHKSNSDVAGTAKKCQMITRETKVKWLKEWGKDGTGGPEQGPRETKGRRHNWRNKELHNSGNGKRIFFIWGFGFGAQDSNIERYTKVAAAIQKAIQCYCVTYDEEKKSYYLDITGSFFSRG